MTDAGAPWRQKTTRRTSLRRDKIAWPRRSTRPAFSRIHRHLPFPRNMIRKSLSVIIAVATFIMAGTPIRAASLQYTDAAGIVARRWVASPIIIAFSTSLNSPPPNIKAGSDVNGAARRALQHWAGAADIQFL